MEHTLHQNFWENFQLAPAALLIVILLIVGLRRFAPGTTTLEKTAFNLGLLSILLVANTPIGGFATTYFWCHMVQHMTLMMISGPLLVIGTVNHWKFSGQIWETVTHPWFIWFAYAGVMIGVHFTSLHTLLMMNSVAHDFVEIPIYLLVAYLFYYHILDSKNSERKITPGVAVLSLFLMMVPETLTGFFIYAAPHSLYENMYALEDQRLGGALMWSGSMIIDSIWLSIAVREWLKSEEKRSREIDEEIAREKR